MPLILLLEHKNADFVLGRLSLCAEYRATARRQPEKDCRQPKHPPPATRNQPPGIKKGLPEPRDGVPADLYANTMYCELLEFVAVHGDEELLVIDCLLQSVLHKFHSLYAIHIRQVVAQYPYSVYILRTVEKIISTGRT